MLFKRLVWALARHCHIREVDGVGTLTVKVQDTQEICCELDSELEKTEARRVAVNVARSGVGSSLRVVVTAATTTSHEAPPDVLTIEYKSELVGYVLEAISISGLGDVVAQWPQIVRQAKSMKEWQPPPPVLQAPAAVAPATLDSVLVLRTSGSTDSLAVVSEDPRRKLNVSLFRLQGQETYNIMGRSSLVQAIVQRDEIIEQLREDLKAHKRRLRKLDVAVPTAPPGDFFEITYRRRGVRLTQAGALAVGMRQSLYYGAAGSFGLALMQD